MGVVYVASVMEESFQYMIKPVKLISPSLSDDVIYGICQMYRYVSIIRFDNSTCCHMTLWSKKIIELFVKCEGGDISRGQYIDTSRKEKFFLHYVNDSIVLDRNFILMEILLFAFSKFYWNKIDGCFVGFDIEKVRNDSMLVPILRILMLEKQDNAFYWSPIHNSPCGELVYDQRRQFRLVHNAKLKSMTYLKLLDLDSDATMRNFTTVSTSISSSKAVLE